MAREEQDREDLLGEATAFVERAEITVVGQDDPLVIGFRRDGAVSVFFGADPVYHFNALGQLRRAYVESLLFKAEDKHLVSLRRVRTSAEVQLVRHVLDSREQEEFLAAMRETLRELSHTLESGGYQVSGQVPVEADVAGSLLARLPSLLDAAVADSPRVS